MRRPEDQNRGARRDRVGKSPPGQDKPMAEHRILSLVSDAPALAACPWLSDPSLLPKKPPTRQGA